MVCFLQKSGSMKAIIYLVGSLVLLAGVIFGLMQLGVPPAIQIVVGLVIGGLGIMGAAKNASSSKTISQTTADSAGNMKTTETTVAGE